MLVADSDCLPWVAIAAGQVRLVAALDSYMLVAINVAVVVVVADKAYSWALTFALGVVLPCSCTLEAAVDIVVADIVVAVADIVAAVDKL